VNKGITSMLDFLLHAHKTLIT